MPTDVCRWLILLISLSTWTTNIYSKDVRVVCYYTNWSVYRPGQAKFSPQNINPYLCTHLIYAFGGFTKENTLKPFDKYQDIEKGGYAKFTGLKTYNKNLKTMLAIGGWNEGSSRFSPMVASADRRKELVKNAVKFLRQNHFDGLDLDWEYPTFRDGGKARDRDNYAQLVKELREEFERESEKTGRPRLLLTMAVPAGIEYINKGYDVPKLSKYLDWMNILSYDYHSAFEPAVNHHAPLFGLEEDSEYNYDADLNIDHTIKHYLELGADPHKLVLGIPTYGRSYTLFNPDATEIGDPADGPGDMGEATRENGYLAYYEICDYVKSQEWEVVQPDDEAMGPYAYKGNQWVGYDDEAISRKKAAYVAKNNLGGIMFWAIDNDDFRGNCHNKPYPIIEAAKEALLEAYGITDDNLIAPTSKPATKQRTRTRTKITSKDENDNQVSTSSVGRRRTSSRVKTKTTEAPPSGRSKLRRNKNKASEKTSTYSSLKVVTPSYTTPAPPSTPDQGGAFKCEDEGFFPHPKDCKKYFWCLSGAGDSGIIAHQFTCPAGLYFNKAADSCDYTQNVLCNKKLSRTTAANKDSSTSSSSTTEKPTPSSIFSTSRAPPKITAATSRTTYSAKTTEATPEEDEYEEYEDDEEEEEKRGDSEEDPRVIKELIDLIRKAGGIEELEKRLHGDTSSTGPDSTTPSIISQSLVARVLGQSGRNKITQAKTFSFANKNSRGSQTEGISRDEGTKKVDRGRPQYTSISRFRPTSNNKDDEDEDEDEDVVKESVKRTDDKTIKKTNTVEYFNIRRPKVSTTTESQEDNIRNRILGESDDEEEDDEENVSSSNNRKTTPKYVNIRRQRPATTEEPSTSKYKEIRRGQSSDAVTDEESTSSKYKTIRRGTTPASLGENEEDDGNSRYKTIRRGTTPAPATSVSDEEETSSKYKAIQRGTTTTEATKLEDSSSLKYNTIRRGTTTPAGVTVKEEESRGTTVKTVDIDNDINSKYKSIRRGTTTPESNHIEDSTDITTTATSTRGISTTTSKSDDFTTFPNDIDVTTEQIFFSHPDTASSISTTKLQPVTTNEPSSPSTRVTSDATPAPFVTRRTPPTLFEPRPFSVRGTSTKKTEATTQASKVSETNYKLRLRTTTKTSDLQNGLSTESSFDTSKVRGRGYSKFSSNDDVKNDFKDRSKDESTNGFKDKSDKVVSIRSRKRYSTTSTTTEKYSKSSLHDDDERTYRPSEIADLSSLTAIDFHVIRGLGGENSAKRGRGRPRPTAQTTTTTTEKPDDSLKTGSRTLTLARKQLQNLSFGKSNRRIVSKVNETDLDKADTNAGVTSRIRGYPKAPRKVIRRFRTTTANSIDDDDDDQDDEEVKIRVQRPSSTETYRDINVKIGTKNSIQDILSKRPGRLPTVGNVGGTKDLGAKDEDDADDVSTEEGENIKLSESNIRENSDVNNNDLISNNKDYRKFNGLKLGKVQGKFDVDEKSVPELLTSSTTTTTTEANLVTTKKAGTPIIVRTRKIIRKLRPTTEAYNSTDGTTTVSSTVANEYGRKRKVIRRLLPVSLADGENRNRKLIVRGRPTTVSSVDDDDGTTKTVSRGRFRPTVPSIVEDKDEETTQEIRTVPRGRFRLTPPSLLENRDEATTKRYTFIKTDEDNYKVKTYAQQVPERSEDKEKDDVVAKEDEDKEEDYDDVDEYDDEDIDETTEAIIPTTRKNNLLRKQGDRPSFKSPRVKSTAAETTTPAPKIVKDYRQRPRPSFRKPEVSSTTENLLTVTKAKYKFYTRSTTSKTRSSTTPTVVVETTSALPVDLTTENATTDFVTTTEDHQDDEQDLRTTTEEELVTLANLILDVTTEDGETSTLTDLTDDVSTDITSIVDDLLIDSNLTGIKNYTNVTTTTTARETTTTSSETTSTTARETTTTAYNATKTTTETLVPTTEQSLPTTDTTLDIDLTTVDDNETTLETTSSPLNITTELPETTKLTTPYIRRSTLRSINARPKFSPPRRASTRSSSVETSTRPTSRFKIKNRFSGDVNKRLPTRIPTRLLKTTTAIPVDKFIYKYNAKKVDEVEYDDDDDDEEEEVEEKLPITSTKPSLFTKATSALPVDNDDEDDEDYDVEEEHEAKPSTSPRPFTFTRSTTPRVINSPIAPKTTNKVVNAPAKPKFHKTTEAPVVEDLGINAEAIKTRNKNLFSKKRVVNTPVAATSVSPINSTEDLVTLAPQVTKPVSVAETTESLTTLHHIFAESLDDNHTSSTTETNQETASKIEKLIEVNRIIEVVEKDAKSKNHTIKEETKHQVNPVVDKIGAINRVTVIKVVDGNNVTIEENSYNNEVNPKKLPVNININGPFLTPELAVVKEISPNDSDYKSFTTKDDFPSNHRRDRKYEIYGESKVLDYNQKSVLPNEIVVSGGKAEIIDGNSHVNIITPRPSYSTEASTISLERLFLTDTPRIVNGINGNLINLNNNEELLETQNSRFVNVRVLDQSGTRVDKGVRDNTKLVPIRILKPDEEEVTMKAHVVEVSPRSNEDTIKIVPIRVEMSRKLVDSSAPFKTRLESGVPKIDKPQPSRPFRVGPRRKTTFRPSSQSTTLPPTVPTLSQRTTKLTRRKYLPQTTKPLESQDYTTTPIPTTRIPSRFRFISRKPTINKILVDSKKNLILAENSDQTIESSNQQSLEEQGGETTELGDTAIALHDIQQAPNPSTTTTTTKSPFRTAFRYTTLNVDVTPKSITRVTTASRNRQRFSTTLPPAIFTTTKYVIKKKRPQAFDKINPSDTNTYRPLSEYDYYDDEMSILGRIPEHSKVLLHSNGVIECLDQGNFPHPVSCKKFISCAKMENGKVLGWEYTCPKNLSFDPIGGICNWSAGLGCHEQ